MLIGGWQKMSLLDYPDKVTAVLFTVGCNLRCGFCHNSELVRPEDFVFGQKIGEEEIWDFLRSRQGLLDAVTVSGGEPTLQPDLLDFLQRVKVMGFLVKLDTNGTNAIKVKEIMDSGVVDFWAMDIKAPLEHYGAVAGRLDLVDDVAASIYLIKNSGVEHEFRSTLVAGTHTAADVERMAQLVQGAKKLVLQKFVPRERLVDPAFLAAQPFSDAEMTWLAKSCEPWVKKCEVR